LIVVQIDLFTNKYQQHNHNTNNIKNQTSYLLFYRRIMNKTPERIQHKKAKRKTIKK
jgi:hypothetical protein